MERAVGARELSTVGRRRSQGRGRRPPSARRREQPSDTAFAGDRPGGGVGLPCLVVSAGSTKDPSGRRGAVWLLLARRPFRQRPFARAPRGYSATPRARLKIITRPRHRVSAVIRESRKRRIGALLLFVHCDNCQRELKSAPVSGSEKCSSWWAGQAERAWCVFSRRAGCGAWVAGRCRVRVGGSSCL
jgi:hypothetical protein